MHEIRPVGAQLARGAEFLAQFYSFPFDDACAARYAEVRASPAAKAQPIGSNDLLIAATALANGTTLVTHNTREFARVDGLQVVDWES